MEFNYIDIFQSVVFPATSIIIGYFGWKATAEKNKLKAEVEGLKANNESLEIKNQSSWIDLYQKLHEDQARRLLAMETELQKLKKDLIRFEYAFKKHSTCSLATTCPIHLELQKFQDREYTTYRNNRTEARQREPPD